MTMDLENQRLSVCFAGMLQPDSGSIKVGGESMEAEPEKIRNSISVVFQDFAHYEDTLRNNITVSDPERTSSDEN